MDFSLEAEDTESAQSLQVAVRLLLEASSAVAPSGNRVTVLNLAVMHSIKEMNTAFGVSGKTLPH